MSGMHAVRCDQCGRMEQTRTAHDRPPGWLRVYADSASFDFHSVQCLRLRVETTVGDPFQPSLNTRT